MKKKEKSRKNELETECEDIMGVVQAVSQPIFPDRLNQCVY